MASNYTTNFGLCQWEATDQVQRTEFNADNAKIDQALKARNCRFYLTAYVGTGSGSVSLTFPSRPIFVTVMGGRHTWLCTLRNAPEIYLRMDAIGVGATPTTWEENTLTWAEHINGGEYYANAQGSTYYVMALLEAD